MSGGPSGIFAPVTTPFDPHTGDFAPVAAQDNARRLAGDGLAGLVVGGSTGEAPLLDAAELCRAVAAAREAVPADRRIAAGAGAESTRACVALCRATAAAGADLVLVRPPGYFAESHSRASLETHFRSVADASPVPVLVYNIPKYTRLPLEPELIHALADHGNIVGIKDSSGDLGVFAAYRAAAPRWAALTGSAGRLGEALALGASGGIVGVACFAAARCVALYRAFAAREAEDIAGRQHVLAQFDREIVTAYGPAGVKVAMDAVGLYGGVVRPPLAELDADERQRVARLVRGD